MPEGRLLSPGMADGQTGAAEEGGSTTRLYDGVIRARILYEAPVWAKDLMASRRSRALLRKVQKTTAIRIARGHRTVSYASATVLAVSPPYELQALALKRIFEDRMSAQEEEEANGTPDIKSAVEEETWERWRAQLEEEAATQYHRAVSAVLPNWDSWKRMGGVPLTFRTTQVLTGHGVFGEYRRR